METPTYKRGYKMYLDKAQTVESEANWYFGCRDGIVNIVSYNSDSGYGNKERILFCEDTKHESVTIIKQILLMDGNWKEETFSFDSDSFQFFKAMVNEQTNILGGKFETLRNYMHDQK